MLAYDYPLLSVALTIIVIAAAVVVLFVIIWALIDNFQRHDHGGWMKALWLILIILLPIIGVVIYFIARPSEEVRSLS